ncbi:hypothetical protein B0H10DRAFT_1963615 [Mycena sp. CBHHK59/15]|nr:hypothetical protein B0H10DRAFT_1963615 [Mycena sp. CBHHK59/15]
MIGWMSPNSALSFAKTRQIPASTRPSAIHDPPNIKIEPLAPSGPTGPRGLIKAKPGPGMLLVLPNGRITHSLCHKTPVTSFPHPFSRRALVVEGPEQSDHSDAPDLSDDDSFMNLDSPIPSPKAPQDYDSELELPTVEWRSPSPLEYIPDSDLPSTQIGPLLQSVPETEDLADHDEQENGSSAPATMPDAVSSAPTSSESAPPGITVTPNLGAEPTARRSGRKRKEREELKDLSAALSACICGSSAAPLDSSEHPNVPECVAEDQWIINLRDNRHFMATSVNGTPTVPLSGIAFTYPPQQNTLTPRSLGSAAKRQGSSSHRGLSNSSLRWTYETHAPGCRDSVGCLARAITRGPAVR